MNTAHYPVGRERGREGGEREGRGRQVLKTAHYPVGREGGREGEREGRGRGEGGRS